ncbi:MAG: hypothetical protein IT210_09990, partial [Armatimonadetes bacterium]|nr:hypothetical protein [Armatimonadota bacterium]
MMASVPTLPQWSPRVTQQEIRRLYETDAKGIYDEELLDEVGWGLAARCASFLEATEAAAGRAKCPICSAVVAHSGDKAELLRCTCGWELTWDEYFKTIQRKHLSGAEPVREQFGTFLRAFPGAAAPQEKMLLIGRLIHGFLRYFKTDGPPRPVAINLIEGKLDEVVAFLDSLT